MGWSVRACPDHKPILMWYVAVDATGLGCIFIRIHMLEARKKLAVVALANAEDAVVATLSLVANVDLVATALQAERLAKRRLFVW